MQRSAVLSCLLTAALGFALAGCGGGDERTRWVKDGRTVDTAMIESYRGAGHCDWEKVTFLNVGWPLGTASDSRAHQYVRDPDGVLEAETRAEYQAHASLPDAAEDTGYASELGELWLAPGDQDTVAYLVSDHEGRVEAWPRTRQLLGCD